MLLEKAVDFDGVLNVVGMYHTQYIKKDAVLLQEMVRLHDLLVGRLATFADTVPIVQLLRTIQAESHVNFLCRQKSAPIFIQKCTVGLNTVGDLPARGAMFALQGHDLAKIFQPQEGRFPAMPGKVDDGTRKSPDMLDDIFLEDILGHGD